MYVGVGRGDYRKLRAWKKSHALAISVYQATEGFPATETDLESRLTERTMELRAMLASLHRRLLSRPTYPDTRNPRARQPTTDS